MLDNGNLLFDPNILSHALDEYVTKGQKQLKVEFDYKRKMIVINSNDHSIILSFYHSIIYNRMMNRLVQIGRRSGKQQQMHFERKNMKKFFETGSFYDGYRVVLKRSLIEQLLLLLKS